MKFGDGLQYAGSGGGHEGFVSFVVNILVQSQRPTIVEVSLGHLLPRTITPPPPIRK